MCVYGDMRNISKYSKVLNMGVCHLWMHGDVLSKHVSHVIQYVNSVKSSMQIL